MGIGPSELRIEEGSACVWFAYDLGQQIDLDHAQRLVAAGSEREQIRHQRHAPAYLQFRPAPLRIDETAQSIEVAGRATDARVEVTVYDFGAVSIAYRVPIVGLGLPDLPALASALGENPLLLGDSKQRVVRLLEQLGAAIRRGSLAELVEDYTVFHVRRWSPPESPDKIIDDNRELAARILRAEILPMHESEVHDALQCKIAYGLADDLVIDWGGALLFDSQGEDTLAVLEFANVELLEMRYLDDRLDDALENSNEALRARGRTPWLLRLGRAETRDNMRRIADMQVENALLFESVNNAIKLLGDQFLARVYRLAARRLHLEEWDASILRKLQTLESIYEKLHDEQSTRRMEVLEGIIIVLILISIVLPFLVGGGH